MGETMFRLMYKDKNLLMNYEKNNMMSSALMKNLHVKNESDLETKRIKTSNELNMIISYAHKIGMKDLYNITQLDNINIPVFSVKHDKIKTNIINYNSGKGTTEFKAKVSAVMEYIERKSSISINQSNTTFKFNELKYYDIDSVINPSDLITHFPSFIAEDININWFPVVDIVTGEHKLCPTIAVLYNYFDSKNIFINNTNGLAAGTSYCEAIIHGIYEVVERDSLSIAFAGGEFKYVDKNKIPNEICKTLIQEYENNDIEICIIYFKNDFNMPCFIVTGNDKKNKSPFLLSGGFGCHSNKDVALTRALTELEQTRKVIIEAKREDICYMRPNGNTLEEYNRILKIYNKWYHTDGNNLIDYCNIESNTFNSSINELSWQTKQLNKIGFKIYAANLTLFRHDLQIPVVRVIIPGLENWYKDKKRIGLRVASQSLFSTLGN